MSNRPIETPTKSKASPHENQEGRVPSLETEE